jgi:hypothetical protein
MVGNFHIYLFRGTKTMLEQKDLVYDKNILIVELEDNKSKEKIPKKDLYNLRRPYKIGDGIHKYSELPYESGLIPVAFDQPRWIVK